MSPMEHPFVKDLETLAEEDLVQRIYDLRSKLNWCLQQGKGDVAKQISMAVDSYQSEYNRRVSEKTKDVDEFKNKITIK
jgi:hypothetical protein